MMTRRKFDGGQEDEELDGEEDDDDDDDHVPYPGADCWIWNDYLKRWMRRSEDHQGLGEFEPEPCVSAPFLSLVLKTKSTNRPLFVSYGQDSGVAVTKMPFCSASSSTLS